MKSRIYNLVTEKDAFCESCIKHGWNFGQAIELRRMAFKHGIMRVECSVSDQGIFDAQPRSTKDVNIGTL